MTESCRDLVDERIDGFFVLIDGARIRVSLLPDAIIVAARVCSTFQLELDIALGYDGASLLVYDRGHYVLRQSLPLPCDAETLARAVHEIAIETRQLRQLIGHADVEIAFKMYLD